jgi:hypothetical protein
MEFQELINGSCALVDNIQDARANCGIALSRIGAIVADVVDTACMTRYASIWLNKQGELVDMGANIADGDVAAACECQSAIKATKKDIAYALNARMKWITEFIAVLNNQIIDLDRIHKELSQYTKESLKKETAKVNNDYLYFH